MLGSQLSKPRLMISYTCTYSAGYMMSKGLWTKTIAIRRQNITYRLVSDSSPMVSSYSMSSSLLSPPFKTSAILVSLSSGASLPSALSHSSRYLFSSPRIWLRVSAETSRSFSQAMVTSNTQSGY